MKAIFNRHKNTLSKTTLLSVFILLFLILSVSAFFDYLSRRRAVIRNMIHNSQITAKVIQKSTSNSIILHRLLNYYVVNWFKTNLEAINDIENIKAIDNNFLKEHAIKSKIFHICLYDSAGNREYYSDRNRYCLNYRTIIEPFMKGQIEESEVGIQKVNGQDQDFFVLALKRKTGGVIVGSLRANRLYAIQNVIGIEKYLDRINTDSSIIYIVMQDSSGITAKTKNLNGMQHTLPELQTDIGGIATFQWRIVTFNNQRIFEAILPIESLNRPYGIIRIALDYSPVSEMQKIVRRQIFIRLLILLIIGFVLLSYSISIQNFQMLTKEKTKITNEVYSLQHDLRQKEKMSAVGELAAGIAHEIRNPLGAISMTVQRLSREFKPEKDAGEIMHLLDIIRKESDHISNSIKNLLQFSKPAPLQRSQNRIDTIIAKIISLYQSKAEKAGIRLTCKDQSTAEAFIDPVKIEDCLVNLLENALAATPAGGRIEFGLAKRQQTVVITLRDTGIGIPEKNLSKIFNLYYTTKADGTGLGLAHAQQIISEHGGTIRVDSQESNGTTFTITLPGN